MLNVDEAIARIRKATTVLGSETVGLAQAGGRVLAQPVVATLDNPPFDASAMDGYAVRAVDAQPGVDLRQIGVVAAGDAPDTVHVAPGTCARIFTGAAVPTGADCVIMQENATVSDAGVRFSDGAEVGRNIRKRGHDFRSGDTLIAPGTALGAAHVALAAAGNVAELTVRKRPSIAILATGDELVAPGGTVGPGQIVGSNSPGLTALFTSIGDIRDAGIAGDDRETLSASISGILAGRPDIVITTGGASVGDHDHVQDVLIENGVAIDFWRLAMRPGKPLMFGQKGKTLIFGLPGNPVSALVTAQVFVLPALRAMLGQTEPDSLVVPLGSALPANGPRRHYIRARFERSGNGETQAVPIGQTDSGHLSSLAQSDCLIIQRENAPELEAGTLVEVLRTR